MCCPARSRGGKAIFAGEPVETANAAAWRGNGKTLELGVRPEFVTFAAEGIPVDVVKVLDVGRYRIVETRRRPAARSNCSSRKSNAIPTGRRMLASIRSTRRFTRTAGW